MLSDMSQRVLIVPDKFKGTLTAAEAAAAIARGWSRRRPGDVLERLPMSDGGDGFGDAMSRLANARRRMVWTVDAAHRRWRSAWWWEPKARTAIIESASSIGLALLPRGRYHPFDLDTAGLAAVLLAASRAGARECLIGIGGSATNDGGFGVARALGWVFLDGAGVRLDRWTDLRRLRRIEHPARELGFDRVRVAVDVRNRLLGPAGCSRVYGPQKGLRPEDLPLAEASLSQLARVVRRQWGIDIAREPGAGAAGGLGFGLRAFLGAQIESGFDLFAREARLVWRLEGVDRVITGEGSVDRSSLMGKGVGEVVRLCEERGKPWLGLAGRLGEGMARKRMSRRFMAIVPDLADEKDAMARAGYWLEKLAEQAAESTETAGAKRAVALAPPTCDEPRARTRAEASRGRSA